MKLRNIVYADINLNFDNNLFIEEFDKYILPYTEPFVPVHTQWSAMEKLNKFWHILEKEEFDEYNKLIKQGETSIHGMTHFWSAVNLMYNPNELTTGVGALWRSNNRNNDLFIKENFSQLKIVEWIQNNIPFKKLSGIHCVTIPENGFASIHRDAFYLNPNLPNHSFRNGFFKEGFMVICLNISDGGVPLLWALDHEKESPKKVNSKCYISNDYFLHGVPRTTSRRRQVRISFFPDEDFFNLLDQNTMIILPEDYHYS